MARKAPRALKTMLLSALGMVAALTIIPLAPGVESALFPVTSKAEIVQRTPGVGFIDIWVKFEKRRDCEFVRLFWTDDEGRWLDMDFIEGRKGSRPVTEFTAGPWRLYHHTTEGIQGFVLHRCHPLWSQWTRFYG